MASQLTNKSRMYWVWTSVARKLGEDRNTFFFIFLAASFSYNTCTVSDNTCVDTKRLNEYLASGNKPTRIPVITGYWYIVLQPQYGNKTKKKLWYFVEPVKRCVLKQNRLKYLLEKYSKFPLSHFFLTLSAC